MAERGPRAKCHPSAYGLFAYFLLYGRRASADPIQFATVRRRRRPHAVTEKNNRSVFFLFRVICLHPVLIASRRRDRRCLGFFSRVASPAGLWKRLEEPRGIPATYCCYGSLDVRPSTRPFIRCRRREVTRHRRAPHRTAPHRAHTRTRVQLFSISMYAAHSSGRG